jgi:hypothetical protein
MMRNFKRALGKLPKYDKAADYFIYEEMEQSYKRKLKTM